MKPLLLLIDLQNDFLAAEGLEPSREEVVRRAADLLDGFRAVEAPVVHVWTTVSRAEDRRMPHWKREGRWICEEGTPGHAPPPELRPRPGETVVHKTGFSAFVAPELDALLRAKAVDLVAVAGVHGHACVRQAVLDVYERHPVEILVAADATASYDSAHAEITRRYLERRAARYVPVTELVARLRAPRTAREATG
jgi:nicotinamidase-related amidase